MYMCTESGDMYMCTFIYTTVYIKDGKLVWGQQ